mmetsp:Transcript_44611/g.129766  ORF Transcript_44611/g.129766 Transcript_44611/m.129766 type:complete len:487 (+) Transcript_44611:190-1650(+)
MEIRLGGTFYRLGRKIGAGAYGDVHIATNLRTGAEVAVKLEPAGQRPQTIISEAMVYQLLADAPGVAKLHWYGVVGDLNVMVMDLLGPSLEDLLAMRRARGRRGLGLRRVVALGEQALDRLEHLHRKNFVHRDLKPENLLLGRGAASGRVHMIDYGLAKKYRDAKTRQHIPPKEFSRPVGNIAFSSLAAVSGFEPSRRDDLEALGYVLVYLLRGKLPWLSQSDWSPRAAGTPDSQERKLEQQRRENTALAKKKATTLEALCKKCPAEIATFIQYCQALRFEDEPDYAYLRNLLRSALASKGVAPTEVPVGENEAVNLEWWVADEPDGKSAKSLGFAGRLASMRKKDTGRLATERPGAAVPLAGGAAGVGAQLPSLLGRHRRGAEAEDGADVSSIRGRYSDDSDWRSNSVGGDDDDDDDYYEDNPVMEVPDFAVEDNPVFQAPLAPDEEDNPVFEESNPVFQAKHGVGRTESSVASWVSAVRAKISL